MNAHDAAAIYDKFPPDGKNMPRREFIRQLTGLTCQKNIQTDLAGIQQQKASRMELQARNKRIINRAVAKNN